MEPMGHRRHIECRLLTSTGFRDERSCISMDWSGKRVTVMGLGHFGGNEAAVRFLCRTGAEVVVTDLADESVLQEPLRRLSNVPVAAYRLGGHRIEDFYDADVVVVNPAVRPGNPLVAAAAQRGATVLTEIELFWRSCPAKVVGVTGSNGKSTTAAMVAAILRADGRRVYLGGNIGRSLLDVLPELSAGDYCVLELSSFQLWWMTDAIVGPEVAIVTSFSPNHLDWHGSMEEYRSAKQRLLRFQRRTDCAVIDPADEQLRSWLAAVRGRATPPVDAREIPELKVPGKHNRFNARLAMAAGRELGCSEDSLRQGLMGYCGLPQRLEWFAEVGGRRFYNDSASTTPESTAAAAESIEGPLWLIAGGKDKGCDLRPIAEAAARFARGAAYFGSVAERLRGETAAVDSRFPAQAFEVAAEALRWCFDRSRPGDAIVFSPGCASTDQYRNYRRRGEEFDALVRSLCGRAMPPAPGPKASSPE